jgi:hypothetical protein
MKLKRISQGQVLRGTALHAKKLGLHQVLDKEDPLKYLK